MNLGSVFSGLFKKKSKSCLGIDLGASSIKIVELSKDNGSILLANYVMAKTRESAKIDFGKLGSQELALIIRHMLDRAGIKTRKAVISLPVSETFSTVIDLPVMNEKELAQTIPFEARKYVPVPIEEVVLDWSLVAETVQPLQSKKLDSSAQESQDASPAGQASEKKTLHVLIVAVPREVIKRIASIAEKVGLEVAALEQESFCMTRSLVKEGGVYMVADMGTESLDTVIIENGDIKLVHSFREVDSEKMLLAIPKLLEIFEAKYSRKIEKIIFTGGRSARPGLVRAASAKNNKKFFLGNPFAGVKFNDQLKGALEEISPYMAVAVGGAMREVQ